MKAWTCHGADDVRNAFGACFYFSRKLFSLNKMQDTFRKIVLVA